MKSEKELKEERLKRSQDLANKVKDGSYVDHQANLMESWYPIRPKIKKDEKEIARTLTKLTVTKE